MIAIAGYTMLRMKEPACILLMLGGCFMAALLGGATPLDMPLITESIPVDSGAIVTTGMAALLMFVLVFGVILSATDIPRECRSRCIAMLLAKPIRRRQYVLGKFLGLFGVAYLLYLLLLGILAVFSFSHFPSGTLFLRSFGAGAIAGLYLAPVLAVAVMWSAFFDEIPSVLLAVLYIVLCFGTMFIPVMAQWAPPGLARILLALHLPFANPLYFIFPRVAFLPVGWLVLYAGSGSLLYGFLAVAAFERKDIL